MTEDVSDKVDDEPVTAEPAPILDPEEIQALMASMAPDEATDALFAELPALKQPQSVEEFSFPQGDGEGPARYPLFVNLQERMIESLQEQWSSIFGRDITVAFDNMKANEYHEVIEAEESRAFFAYEVEGHGRMMLAFDLPLIVAYVDAMLGGIGEVFGEHSLTLSPVETRLSKRIAKSLEEHLEAAWKPLAELDFHLFKLETDSQFLSVTGAQDTCFSIYYEVQLGEDMKHIFSVHYPRSFLEPMLESLRSSMTDDHVAVDGVWVAQLEQAISGVPLTMRLEMGRCAVDIGQFLKLSSGDYLPLKTGEADPVTLWIDKMPMFLARAGSQEGMLAAELIQDIQQGGQR